MNCEDIQKGIYVYLDGEFAEPERVDFEGHVRACAICRQKVERERTFISGVRQAVPRVAAPAGLEDRIRAALAAAPAPDELPRRRAERRPMGFWAAAAAVLVVSGGITVWRVSSHGVETGETPERIAAEAVATHRSQLPMEVRGSQTQIRQFLEANVPFHVDLSFADAPDTQLVGARFTRVDGRDAVLLNYETGGERLSVLQVAADLKDPDTGSEPEAQELAPSFATQAGFDVATFKRRGVMSSVVGAGGTGSVQRLVRAAWQPEAH
ncbi:MAG: zf-HC2 domain-containing protein [Myxococcota bacterium]